MLSPQMFALLAIFVPELLVCKFSHSLLNSLEHRILLSFARVMIAFLYQVCECHLSAASLSAAFCRHIKNIDIQNCYVKCLLDHILHLGTGSGLIHFKCILMQLTRLVVGFFCNDRAA